MRESTDLDDVDDDDEVDVDLDDDAPADDEAVLLRVVLSLEY